MNNHRINRLRTFLSSGGSVCPFARASLPEIAFAILPPVYETRHLRPALRPFVEGQGAALVYVFSQDTLNHMVEQSRSIHLFERVYKEMLFLEQGPKAREAFPRLEAEVAAAFDPASPIHIYLSYQSQPFFSIAMNPLYLPEHPRFAPVASFVITRQADIGAVPKPVREAIKARSSQRLGKEYDANEPYLLP